MAIPLYQKEDNMEVDVSAFCLKPSSEYVRNVMKSSHKQLLPNASPTVMIGNLTTHYSNRLPRSFSWLLPIIS